MHRDVRVGDVAFWWLHFWEVFRHFPLRNCVGVETTNIVRCKQNANYEKKGGKSLCFFWIEDVKVDVENACSTFNLSRLTFFGQQREQRDLVFFKVVVRL